MLFPRPEPAPVTIAFFPVKSKRFIIAPPA